MNSQARVNSFSSSSRYIPGETKISRLMMPRSASIIACMVCSLRGCLHRWAADQLIPRRTVQVRGVDTIVVARRLLGDLQRDVAGDRVVGLVRTHRHLVVERMAPRDGALRSGGGIEPVLHVILLRHTGRAGVTHVEASQDVLHLGWCICVDQEKAPTFGFSRTVRMPHADAPRLAAVV